MIKRRDLYLLTILSALMILSVSPMDAKRKQTVETWPDGTPIASWFKDTTKVDVNALGRQYVVTDYGVKNDSTLLQTDAIQAVIDQAAQQGGGVIVIQSTSVLPSTALQATTAAI